MAKRDLDFAAFDRELSGAKPELAARIGVPAVRTELEEQVSPAPALRVVPDPAPAPEVESPATPVRVKRGAKGLQTTTTKMRGKVVRSDGSEAGRVIVYLPSDIALRLRRYCFENGRSITDVAGEMLSDAIANGLP